MDGVPIDLWLEWQEQSRPAIVVPYAKAHAATLVQYRIVLDKQGASGRSLISQGGIVALEPDVPTPLSRTSVGLGPDDTCTVEVSVRPDGEPPIVKRFDCPR